MSLTPAAVSAPPHAEPEPAPASAAAPAASGVDEGCGEEPREEDSEERHHHFELMRRAHYGGEAEAIRKARELLKKEMEEMDDD